MNDITQSPNSQQPPANSPEGLGITNGLTQPPTTAAPLSRWQRQDIAAALLPGHRVSYCLRHLAHADQVHLMRGHTHDGQVVYAYNGLSVCGSVWECPVCSAKISRVRRHELSAAMESARAKDFRVYLFTQTVRHSVGYSLKVLADRIQQARRLMMNRKVWKRIMGVVQLQGTVRALEVTVGERNGWHVHYHELVFTAADLTDSDIRELKQAWCDAVESTGLPRPSYARGLDVRSGGDADAYVSKWGLTNEITGQEGKSSVNFQPFALLDRIDAGDSQAALWFLEYVAVMKGRSQLRWSKGLRRLLELDAPEMTDEEAAQVEECEVSECVFDISLPIWQRLCRYGWRQHLLILAREVGPEYAYWWLGLDTGQQLSALHSLGLIKT